MILPELNNILLFMTAALVLIIVPGPAVFYLMIKSVEQGYKAGFVSVLGIGIDALVHVVAAAVGVSALLVASSTAFSILKYAGAIYLIYMGVKKLLDKNSATHPMTVKKEIRLKKIFYEAILVNVLNPKTAIFFFAFLPQFISSENGGSTSQIVFLGLLFISVATLSDSVYVLVSGKLSHLIHVNRRYFRIQKRIVASIYILLGLLTLTVNQPHGSISNK